MQQYCAEICVPYLPGMERAGVIVDGPDAGLRVRAMAAAGPAPGVDGGLAEIARPFPVPGGHAEVGASVEIASSPPGGPDEQELIRRAGIAMYQAKRGGRGRRVTYRGAMDASSTVAPWTRAPRWRHGRELHGGAMAASSTVAPWPRAPRSSRKRRVCCAPWRIRQGAVMWSGTSASSWMADRPYRAVVLVETQVAASVGLRVLVVWVLVHGRVGA